MTDWRPQSPLAGGAGKRQNTPSQEKLTNSILFVYFNATTPHLKTKKFDLIWQQG
jgi:hypothetical protein